MFALLFAAASSLASLGGVAAHGYVQDVVVGSTHYTGYLPYSDPYYSPPPERIIRKIPGNGPVQDVTLIEYGLSSVRGHLLMACQPAVQW